MVTTLPVGRHSAGHLGDDGQRHCAGAAAHAGGDEGHVLPQRRPDSLPAVGVGGGLACFRPRGTQPGLPRETLTWAVAGQGLGVGVGGDELDPLDAFPESWLDGVAAGKPPTPITLMTVRSLPCR